MKDNTLLWVGAGILLLLLLSSATTGAGMFDFSSLIAIYGADRVQRLQNLYQAMQGKGLTNLQMMLMLSQALFETGLFTESPNYTLMDSNNNFAGIKVNSRYPNSSNGYAQYPTLDAFVNDWIYVLNFNNQPINATDVDDFNIRLKENGYYGASATTYDTGLWKYYNLLSQNLITA